MEAYLVTDRSLGSPGYLPGLLRRAAEAGVDRIQVREKDLSARPLLGIVREAIEAARGNRATVFVNDRVDVAIAAGAAGVHLGRAAIPPDAARRIAGEDLVVGASAHGIEEALEAQERGADYVILGPIFETPTKTAYGPPLGVRVLEAALRRVRIPVYAIGGIHAGRLDEIAHLPLTGVAMVSEFVRTGSLEELIRRVHRTGAA
jgi:thiamine-phosphate pyrophosphorylase